MRAHRIARRLWVAAAVFAVACSPDDAVTTDPNIDDEPPWPADASVDDDVGPRPAVDVPIVIDDDVPAVVDVSSAADVPPTPIDVPPTIMDVPAPTPVDVPPTPIDVGSPTPMLPEQRCRVESTTYAAAMQELDTGPTSSTRLRFTLPGIPAGVTESTLHYDSFDADHPGEEGFATLNGRRFPMPADAAWDNVTVPGQTIVVTGSIVAGSNVVEFGPGPLSRSFFRIGRVALEFTARVERCPGVVMPMPTDAGTPTGPAVERTIGYRAATYTQRGNWVFRCDANYAYTARGDHASEDCTGGYAPDGTLRGTATFRFTNVAAATYDVLIGSRHSSNRNDMRALFTVNGEANRIDQRTGDGALAIVTDVWGRRALSGTVTVVLDTTRNSGSDSVSFVTLRPVR